MPSIKTTPEGALKLFREESPPAIVEQAELFRKMPEKLRDELLFYMVTHLTMRMAREDGAEPVSLEEAREIIAKERPN